MKAVMLAVTLVAMSSPACAVITQGQALQEVARCTYASSRRDGHYVTYSHALYLAREVKDFSRGLALSGFMTYYPAGTSLKEKIAIECSEQVYRPIEEARLEADRQLSAKKKLLMSAKQGNTKAEYRMGYAYSLGLGEPRNNAKAINWYRKAARQGYAKAEYQLGDAYYMGYGVPSNNAKAINWYRKAVKQGYARAENELGDVYQHALLGMPKNYITAINWYRKAARQGYARAENNLGDDYYSGHGVPKNWVQANSWYRKAAEQGNALGEYSLGTNYYSGHGVPKSRAKALYWLNKAANHGLGEAMNSILYIVNK